MSSLSDKLSDFAVFPVRVIIVEDEEAVAEALRDLLESKGYLVETLRCPMTALKRLGIERFDVVLLDYRMPTMNGRQFFEKARRRGITLPTVLISGFVDETRLMEMVNLGLCRFLQKPASGEALFDCLQSLGFGPDEVLSRQAEWAEWRAQWDDSVGAEQPRTTLRLPDAPPANLLFPLQIESQREIALDALLRWREAGLLALTGETGLDFEPFFDALLTEATYSGVRADHLDGSTGPFQEALTASAAATDTISVGWFSDPSALHTAIERWIASGARARVGWVLEEESPVRSPIHPFWRPYRLAPLRERPEAVAHYACALLARQTAETYGQPWAWHPDCGPLLLSQFWPENFRDLSASVDRAVLHSSDETISSATLRHALGPSPSGDISVAEDALAHNLWPVLRQTADDALVATLSGLPLERVQAARATLPQTSV